MLRLPALLLLAGLAACDGRDLYDGLDPPVRDGGHDVGAGDGGADGDADGADADAEAEPPECGYPAEGYGHWPGTALEPFALWSCEAEETSLPRLWCGHAATIVHVVHAWCGICEASTHQLLRDVLAELEGEDVALVEVLVEDERPGDVADVETCEWWDERLPEEVVPYIPVDGETRSPLWDLADSEPLPHTVVLDSRGIIRVWSPVAIPGDLAEQIREVILGT